MTTSLRLALVFGALLLWSHPAQGVTRSHHELPTGNGHGFQIFDRQENRITTFLEAPYRYVAPSTAARDTEGVGRRDLAHDLYFGLRVGSDATWIHNQTDIEYEEQTHVIHGRSSELGLTVDTHYFSPFGYEGNAMVMLLKLTNNGGSDVQASAFAKANMKLGQGRTEPGDNGETIQWNASATPPHGVETGAGGGHVLYVPIGGTSHVGCGADSTLYNQVAGGADIGDTPSCSGDGQVIVLQEDLTVRGGGSTWWGMGVVFLNDNPQVPQAADFNDQRTQAEIL
ncbi:MAG: hypothetical protein VX938_11295, partial [Myxococcota bacterium]|nr:hypothetical protein [Myxococcota bacterium]